jgi:hypothetical protein
MAKTKDHTGHHGQKNDSKAVEGLVVAILDIEELQHSITGALEGKWVGKDERNSNSDTTEAHQSILDGIVVKNQTRAVFTKRQETKRGDGSKDTDCDTK